MVTATDVRTALTTIEDSKWADSDISSVREIEEGVNDTFTVTIDRDGTTTPDSDCLIVKFATISRPGSFRAGVAAYRLLSTYTDLPVPEIYSFSAGTTELPAFYVAEYLPGNPPDDPTAPLTPVTARTVGRVIDGFASIPASSADGYGTIREWDGSEPSQACAEYNDFSTWLVEYAEKLYEDPPAHDQLERVAPDVPAFIRSNRDQLPSTPDPSVVVTDFRTDNLLVTDNFPETDRVPAAEETKDGVPELSGVVDLERAKIGPAGFTAVNAEYLMTRGVDDPEPLVDALYAPLPFGPDIPTRELYWLVAMGRSVYSLDHWYERGTEQYKRRGDVIASTMDRIIN